MKTNGKVVHWGILGAGKVAKRFAKSLANEKRSTLTAIAVRKMDKAEEFRKIHDFERLYLNYDELLNDKEIDAVYIAVPHALHKEWSIKALEKGKAVLCEKPAALTSTEVQTIAMAAHKKQCLFMEAMKSRFVPAYQEVKKIIGEGTIGSVQHIDAKLCSLALDSQIAQSYHTQQKQGGALLDLGIYCANWIEDFLYDDICVSSVSAKIKNQIDYHVEASLISKEKTAKFEVAFDCSKPKELVIYGTNGRIEVTDFHRSQIFKIFTKNHCQTIEKPYLYDDFYGEISHFVQLLEDGYIESPIMSLQSSINCAKILDLVREGFLSEND